MISWRAKTNCIIYLHYICIYALPVVLPHAALACCAAVTARSTSASLASGTVHSTCKRETFTHCKAFAWKASKEHCNQQRLA
jgi:hypothetical protein